MPRILLLLGLAVALFLLFRWMMRQPPRVFWQSFAILVALGLLALVVTGRAHWLTAFFAAALPFIRTFALLLIQWFPQLRRLLRARGAGKSAAPPGSGQTSTVQGKYVRMTLDHDSGDLAGEVLDGQFAGRTLEQLSLDELLVLLRECRDDEESVALLQAYLDRVHGDDWRQQASAEEQRQQASPSDRMNREEALQILGLSADASEEQIIEAHRRLMQKVHPDRGGSAYLAAKINLAKDTLLGR